MRSKIKKRGRLQGEECVIMHNYLTLQSKCANATSKYMGIEKH